jgi:hypothetical protein
LDLFWTPWTFDMVFFKFWSLWSWIDLTTT